MNPLAVKYRERIGRTRWRSAQPRESEILGAVLQMLAIHPAVALFWRANAGELAVDHRRVRFGFPGQADILGMLRGGRFFAIEVKTATGRLTRAQERFLENVRTAGGIAAVVRSVPEAALMLDMAQTRQSLAGAPSAA